MAEYGPNDVYYAVRKLLPVLDRDLVEKIGELLARSEEGEKTDNLILDLLLSAGEFPLTWLRAALLGQMDEAGRRMLLRGSSLPGNPHSIPAGSTWVCPTAACDFAWHVRHAGQPVPPCPNHKVALIPKP